MDAGQASGSDRSRDPLRARLSRFTSALSYGIPADEVKQKLENMATKAAGISDILEHQEQRCEELEEKATFIRVQVLERMSLTAMAGMEAAVLHELSEAMNDVYKLVQKRKRPFTRYQQLTRPDISALGEKLEFLMTKFSVVAVVNLRERVNDHDGRLIKLERQRAGLLVYQVPTDLPLVEIPPKPAVFHGRDQLVQSIVQHLCENESCHIPILGPGGIGKTSLAAAVLNDDRIKTKFGANRIFISCEGVTTCDGIVSMLVASLRLQHDTSPRRALLAYLQSLEHGILVLDNAETVLDSEDRANVENWLGTIAGESRVSLMITMRNSNLPMTVRWVEICCDPLLPLSQSSSRQMWLSLTSSEDAELDTLLTMLDGLPIAITLMAALARGSTPSELIEWYKAERSSLLSTGGTTRLTSLEISIRVSLNSRTMINSPLAAEMLSILCLLPDGMQISTFPKALPSIDSPRSNALVLVKTGLALREKGRIRCLSPIREFILQHSSPSKLYLADLRLFFMERTEAVDDLGGEKSREAIAQFSSDFSNILSVLRHLWTERAEQSMTDKLKKDLTESTFNLASFSQFARLGDCMEILEFALPQFDKEDDKASSALCFQTIGNILATGNEYQRAIERYQEARIKYQDIGDRFGIVDCKQSIGDILRMQSKYEDATAILEEARTESRTIGSRFLAAQCTKSIGHVLWMQDRYEEASAALHEARAEFQTIEDRHSTAQCTRSIGEILQMQHRWKEAMAILEEAKTVFVAIGDPVGTAQCARTIGEVLRMEAKYEEATVAIGKAKEDFRAIRDRLGIAQCTQALADILGDQARYREAGANLNEARTEFGACGSRLGIAQCTLGFGEILSLQQNYKEAAARVEHAKVEFQAMGNRNGVARCLLSLGKILYMQNQYGEAASRFEEARTEFGATGSCLGTAWCTQSIGEVLGIQSNHEGAIVNLEEAKVVFESIGYRLGIAQCLRSIGDLLRMQARYEEATANVEKAEVGFRAIRDRLGSAQCRQSIGDIQSMQDKDEDATRRLEQAKTEFQAIGYRLGIAQCLQSLGVILRRKNKCEEGLELLEEARKEFREMGNRLGRAQSTLGIGDILSIQEKYDEAIVSFEEAETDFRAIGSRRGMAQCSKSIATVLGMQGKYEEATATLTKTRTEFRELGSRLSTAQCTQAIGEIMCIQKMYEEAITTLEDAKEEFQEIGSSRSAALCAKSIGEMLGWQGKYEEALESLWEAKTEYKSIGDRLAAAQCGKIIRKILRLQAQDEESPNRSSRRGENGVSGDE
ncbi:TPR-like protein [Dacryopinax primogenitus]|uniref:TPR-like protein n=1 Tax=Dacryopinax primogenitus (strain DJM 731) TaxID=1858805 RepID=M5G9Z2_DACPD|nr:TPR-like protein [Dacryopinax primogenitus]EJU02707.1 TPR-like protein [Dacryopinax primogenitus]